MFCSLFSTLYIYIYTYIWESIPRPLFEWSVCATSPSLAWLNVSHYFKFFQTCQFKSQTTLLPAEQKMYFSWHASFHHCSLHCCGVKMVTQYWFLELGFEFITLYDIDPHKISPEHNIFYAWPVMWYTIQFLNMPIIPDSLFRLCALISVQYKESHGHGRV